MLERLRRAFWPLPALGVLAGVALGVGLPGLERELGGARGLLAFGGESAAARTMLGAIATFTVSIIGLAFSVTLVALTLAAQQLSPRVLRTFSSDRLNQATLAAFLGLAVYALLVLRSVRAGEPQFVPGASVTVAIAGTVVALGLFVAFIENIVRSLQPATIIRRIAKDGFRALDRAGGREGEPVRAAGDERPGAPVRSRRAGYVQSVDRAAVVAALAGAGRCARQRAVPGDFVVSGDVLALVEGDDPVEDELARRLQDAYRIGQERTFDEDAAFPIRQLADIALKGLSPSLNDVTTAENALGSMGELLVRAAQAGLGPRGLRDDAGTMRLITADRDLDALVRLGFDQVRGMIRDDAVLAVRILEILERVRWAARCSGGGGGEAMRQAALIAHRFAASSAVPADKERVRRRHEALF